MQIAKKLEQIIHTLQAFRNVNINYSKMQVKRSNNTYAKKWAVAYVYTGDVLPGKFAANNLKVRLLCKNNNNIIATHQFTI